jgi:hypothetical protein
MMAYRLKMAKIQAIQQLHALNRSARQIADDLGIDRGTVGRHLRLLKNRANAAIPPAGSAGSNAATFSGFPARGGEGNGIAGCADAASPPNPAIPPAGSEGGLAGAEAALPPVGAAAGGPQSRAGRRSECEPYREAILAKLRQGLSAQRIFQDLAEEHGFPAAYDSVKRFVRCLGREVGLPVRRLESAPGDEAQVDFGQGAWIVAAEGKRRKSHVFRIVLSHSRKAYSEATYRQTTEDFIRCLENAFWHFGGLPRTVVIDNLRAAVKHADWYDFPFFQEAQRKVNRDGHIEVAKAYYSVPPEYLRRTVWARWDARLVRVFNARMEQLALHARQEPGKSSARTLSTSRGRRSAGWNTARRICSPRSKASVPKRTAGPRPCSTLGASRARGCSKDCSA